MAQHQIRRLPVVDSGQLIGIVSTRRFSSHRESADDQAGFALSEISEHTE